MDDPDLKIQTFRPTWEEFKDMPKFIQYMESKGAHKAGLARIIPPKEYVPRKRGYDDLTKFGVTIKRPICQAVAKVESCSEGVYQQVNVPLKSMTVTDFKELAESKIYATPEHTSTEELEQFYWGNITNHAGIYGADVNGSITDPDVEHWNINKLGTILDYVGEDYDMSIEGVNTAYLYFGMWKTTFAWHTEDMDLYSINFLHFGAPKTWYAIPPSYGRKFEKLTDALYAKSAAVCPAFLRHKMTLLDPKWLKTYDIPCDTVTQEEGQFMITFPFGYHSGFNHGFNCAESTNFAAERWVEYGKHASICYCCPDAVKISMDAFVKRFQPSKYEDWQNGKDKTPHPEYNTNPHEVKAPVIHKKMSFKERNPELNIKEILDNPGIPMHVKIELNGSFLVSADEEVAGLIAEKNEPERKTALQKFFDESSDEEYLPKSRKRKKADPDYDDDWYETKGHKFISEDGKVEKNLRGRPPRLATMRKTVSPKPTTGPTPAKRGRKKRESAPVENENKAKLNLSGSQITVVGKSGAKVMVMSAKPSDLPNLLLPDVKPQTSKPTNPSNGPSYNDAFANFLAKKTKTSAEPEEKETQAPKNNIIIPSKANAQQTNTPQQSSQKPEQFPMKSPTVAKAQQPPMKSPTVAKAQQPPSKATATQPSKALPESVTIVQRKQEKWTNKVLKQTQSKQKKEMSPSQQRVKTELIQPYVSGQNQLFSVQPTVENGQPVFYRIVNSTNATTTSHQKC